MPFLFEKFIGFFELRVKGKVEPISSMSGQHQVNNTDFLSTYVCGLSCVVEAEGQIHTQTYHYCFEEAFSSFVVVFATGVRLNLTSKVSIDSFIC